MLDTITLLLCVDPGTSPCLRSKEPSGRRGATLEGRRPESDGGWAGEPVPQSNRLHNVWVRCKRKMWSLLIKLWRILRWQQRSMKQAQAPGNCGRAAACLWPVVGPLCSGQGTLPCLGQGMLVGGGRGGPSSSSSSGLLWEDHSIMSPDFLWSAFFTPSTLFSHLQTRDI